MMKSLIGFLVFNSLTFLAIGQNENTILQTNYMAIKKDVYKNVELYPNKGSGNNRHGELFLWNGSPPKVQISADVANGGGFRLFNSTTSISQSLGLHADINLNSGVPDFGNLHIKCHTQGSGSTSGPILDLIRLENAGNNQVWDIGLYNARTILALDIGTIMAYQYQGETVATIASNGSWYQWSDARFKTKIRTIEHVLPKIKRLNPAKYEMKQTPGETQYGFIAQDLIKQFPELVFHLKNEQEDHYLVDYTGMIPVLAKAIQEQEIQLTAKKQKIEQAKAQIVTLKKEIIELKGLIKLVTELENSAIEK